MTYEQTTIIRRLNDLLKMFGAKRKARKIQVADDNEEKGAPVPEAVEEPMNDGKSHAQELQPTLLMSRASQLMPSVFTAPASNPASVKFGRRPFKGSSLRKSININDQEDLGGLGTSAAADDDDTEGPVVIRPAISRSGSTKLKKKASSSRLSFGPSETTGDDNGAPETFTPKKSTLSQTATENNFRTSLSGRPPPTRFGGEEDRPRYSKEYLDELQSSTPNTPQNIASLSIQDDDMDLDASELEGAVVVPSADLSLAANSAISHIPTEAEIREKKERRARIALEGDAYDEDSEDFISLIPKKKKDDTRLIAEDEDLGEGYDDFVEDGRLELGKKGEKVARHRHRREMAELIQAAEVMSDEEEDDSDAERKAAYEEAQTRAAMDGLHRLDDDGMNGDGHGRLVIPRMKPLPELGECLARMREMVQGMEDQVTQKRRRIEGLKKEKADILTEESTVQGVLNQAGAQYQSVMGVKVDTENPVSQSPLRTEIPANERGLESFGTPTARPDMDEDMQ